MDLAIDHETQQLIQRALAEDIGAGDVTTLATIPAEARARAAMVTREPLVVAGLNVALAVFSELDPSIQMRRLSQDGQKLAAGQVLLHLEGPTRALLSGERVALNFIQRLSGVATQTARYVEAVAGTQAKILDTRKTTPGWRRLEKYAVRCGGGQNHRIGLFDLVLIKDNHLAALREARPDPIQAAVTRARALYPQLQVEVEADSLEQVELAVKARADIILLDNMTPDKLRQAVQIVQGRAKTEASGGVNLSTVRAVAESGVDYISVGSLTHSARAMDVALDFED